MLYKLAIGIILIALNTLSAFACSMPAIGPTKFDVSQYIFVGQVTGYVETTEIINGHQSPAEASMYGKLADQTAGVVVKVKESYYAPATAKQTYEIYRLSLGADCGLYGMPVEWMKERYKIGDWVRVVAGKADHIAEATDMSTGRLEVRYRGSDWMTVIKNDDPALQDNSTVFDYQAYRASLVGDPTLELLKDLRRLSLADQKERSKILDRLTYFPAFCEACTFYLEDVYKAYAADTSEFDHYAALVRKRGVTDKEFQEYQQRLREKSSKP